MSKNLALGTGKRKTAVARVYLQDGNGKISINNKPLEDYFPSADLKLLILKPLEVTDNVEKIDVFIRVSGGGPSGQAGACLHGISRALSKYDSSNHKTLKENGFLTRDSRMVERKKYGQRGARKKFQFSKR